MGQQHSNENQAGSGPFPVFWNRKTKETMSLEKVKETVKLKLISTTKSRNRHSEAIIYQQKQLRILTGIDDDLRRSVQQSSSADFQSALELIRNGSQSEIEGLKGKSKVDVNAAFGPNQMTLLHLAALFGNTGAIRSLMSNKHLDLNVPDRDGNTAIMVLVFGAKNDISACSILLSFLKQHKVINIAHRNNHNATVLSLVAARGFLEFLTRLFQVWLPNKFSAMDVLSSMKLAQNCGHSHISDYFLQHIDYSILQRVKLELEQEENLSGYEACIEFISELELEVVESALDSSQTPPGPSLNTQADKCDGDNNNVKAEKSQNVGIENNKIKFDIGPNSQEIQIVKMSQEDRNRDSGTYSFDQDDCPSLTETLLADYTDFRPGNTVKLKSVSELALIHHGSKARSCVGYFNDIAGKKASVLDINSSGDLYLDVGGTTFVGWVFAGSAIFVDKGPELRIRDGFVTLGDYVEITEDIKVLQMSAENLGGWISEMANFCGKTGRIIHINSTTKGAHIQFPGTEAYCFSSQVLHKSSAGMVQVMDTFGNWIKNGDFAIVEDDEIEFVLLQEESGLPANAKHLTLRNQLVQVGRVEIYHGFSNVQVKFENKSYILNSKLISEYNVPTTPRPHSPDDVGRKGQSYDDFLHEIPRGQLALGKLLGAGGFGQVFLGSWQGSEVAIKKVLDAVTNEVEQSEILNEARRQAGFRHPNIVQLYGISLDKDLWMVMEYIPGESLEKILFPSKKVPALLRTQRLSSKEKIKIATQACSAISYLHGKGFVHADIKPENMIIERQTGNLLVCDFGITRYLGIDLLIFSAKYTNTMKGTLFYMAPEIYNTDGIDHNFPIPTFKSDVWSLAAVLMEMFTFEPIFGGFKSMSAFKVCGDMTLLEKQLKKIEKKQIAKMIRRALDPIPDQRPTCQEMLEFFTTHE